MKYLKSTFWSLFFIGLFGNAQSSIGDILNAGIEDGALFAQDFMAPGAEVAMYSAANGWFNSATVQTPGKFTVTLGASYSPFGNKADKKVFEMNTDAYQFIKFSDGGTIKQVSTVFGNAPSVKVYVEGAFSSGDTARKEFDLPTGIGDENINFMPSAYIQGSVGVFKGTEVKARFLPKINAKGASYGVYGVAVQHELTSHLSRRSRFPAAISVLAAYTRLNATYDFTNRNIIEGENQVLEFKGNTLLFSTLASTKFDVFNVYGGLGYLMGTSVSDVKGTYTAESGAFQKSYEDPFSLKHKTNGLRASVGANISMGNIALNADYAIANFNSISFGINYSIGRGR